MRHHPRPALALLFIAAFLGSVHFARQGPGHAPERALGGRVVVTAPVQLLMYAGDRFLGANLETIRIAATGGDTVGADAAYLIRAHRAVAQLNPCHEDNYHLGNALLSWGGAHKEGSELLRRASECRHWDEFPPFFYGMNEFFFEHNAEAAQRALEVAADRSTGNKSSLKKIAIMIAAGEIKDERMALAYLRSETEQAKDPRLKAMLAKRVGRLEGLVALREAQTRFESRVGRPLANPDELVAAGILDALPTDPLRLGYAFEDGTFRFREPSIQGLERKQ